jgi:DNA-binding MarR family transcriptional regulator
VIEVELTAKARKLVDELLPEHLANEERLLAGLNKRERAELDRLLAKLLEPLEPS